MTEDTGADGARLDVVLDPAIVRWLDTTDARPPWEVAVEDARQALVDAQADDVAGPGVEVAFHVAAVGPAELVGFWLARPSGTAGTALPAVFYLHGGRWTTGDAGTHGALVREIARRARCAVVVPEFSRAPEARFPVALEEVYGLLCRLADQASSWGLRADRIAVAGDCAGASLAVGTTLLTRDRGGPRLRAQLLYYPWLDPDAAGSSHTLFADDPVLGREGARWYWAQYCDPQRPADRRHPALAPLGIPIADLGGLPAAMIVSAEIDVLRDEAEAYAARLRRADVPVTMIRHLGVTHDFVGLTALAGTLPARTALREGVAFLAEALDR